MGGYYYYWNDWCIGCGWIVWLMVVTFVFSKVGSCSFGKE